MNELFLSSSRQHRPAAATQKDDSRQEHRRELVSGLDTLVGILGPLPPGVTIAVREALMLHHSRSLLSPLLYLKITSLVLRLASKEWLRANVASLGVCNADALENIRKCMRTNTDWDPVRQVTWRSDKGVVLTSSGTGAYGIMWSVFTRTALER